MVRVALSAATALLFAAQASAHFLVLYPGTMQAFDDDNEDKGPCGGYTPDLNSTNAINEFHVGGDSIATKSSHSQQNWLWRITTDNSASANAEWTQIGSIFTQSGAGSYCNPNVTVPDSWIGKTAILNIVADAPDGLLYQCCAVKFVAGTNRPPQVCETSAGVEIFNTDDKALSALLTNGGSSGTESSPSGGATGAAPTGTYPTGASNATGTAGVPTGAPTGTGKPVSGASSQQVGAALGGMLALAAGLMLI